MRNNNNSCFSRWNRKYDLLKDPNHSKRDFVVPEDNFPSAIKNCYLYPRDTTAPIIATDHVSFAGQVVAVVVAGKLLCFRLTHFTCLLQ